MNRSRGLFGRLGMERYDLVVVGAGTGGLVSSLIAAGLGARVALVERDRPGGDCLWTGCVPSKALLAAAELAQRMRQAHVVGLAPVDPTVDFAAVMGHVRAAQAMIEPHDSPERLRAAGVEVVMGEARFTAPSTVDVDGRQLRFRRAIVATGSQPVVPPVPGLRELDPLTSDTVWDLDALPARLLVIGGGAIGCELGQAFARLGSQVTIVEIEPRLLPREEERASLLLSERLAAEGVTVRTATRLVDVAPGVATLDEGRVEFDRALVSTARVPSTADVGLERAQVETDERGAITVDGRMRTSNPRIYAVGDVVAGGLPFTHVAAHHARVATPNALLGARRRADHSTIPWVTFTDPEVAHVGLTAHQAWESWGARAVVVDFDYAALDRAVTAGAAYGFARLIGDPRGRLVGATVAAPAAGEAIAGLTAWVATKGKIAAVSRTVQAYPTFAEGPARAADEHVRSRLLNPRTRALARPALALMRAVAR
jgi:pyruvate/2-oxoglutarate dehydrogenase complex dihydrolipoamide dehydrogenase (E3) component